MKTTPGRHWAARTAFAVGIAATLASADPTTKLTYENWAEGFFTHNCLGCHNSNQSGLTRFGAPQAVNFDSLEKIRQFAPLIRRAAVGPDPYMPPGGVTWWWDRASLAEWLDAGMPGESDTLSPVPEPSRKQTLYYQRAGFYFSRPQTEGFHYRFMRFRPSDAKKDDRVAPEEVLYINKLDNGSVIMTRRDTKNAAGGTLRLDYTPGVPILLEGGLRDGRTWLAMVEVRERYWSRFTHQSPDYDIRNTEQWLVSNDGAEIIDNGVIYRLEAYRVTQRNLSLDETTTWWYARGLGLMRRQRSLPSADFEREVITEYNVVSPDDPLRELPYIRAASEEWLPFVGPNYHNNSSYTDYSSQFEVEGVGLLSLDEGPAPTATPTLPYQAPPTVAPPTLTATPFFQGGPPTQPPPTTATATLAPSHTPTPTMGVTDPFGDDGPKLADYNKDNRVDKDDLLFFIRQWHKAAH